MEELELDSRVAPKLSGQGCEKLLTIPTPVDIYLRMTNHYHMFLDDERDPPDDDQKWLVVRSVNAAKAYVREYGIPQFVSFDHDLGKGGTGMEFVHFLINTDMDSDQPLMEDFDWYIHSQNPIGLQNINGILASYLLAAYDSPKAMKKCLDIISSMR